MSGNKLCNDLEYAEERPFIPNLIGMGFPKAGTTFIAKRLGMHRRIKLSFRKELNFWNKAPLEFGEYRALFPPEEAGQNSVFHEWSTDYIYSETALQNLARNVLDDTTFIIAYRDPVASFFSYYNYRRMLNHRCPERHHPLGHFLTDEEHKKHYVWRYFFDIHFARFREYLPNHRTIVIDYSYLLTNLDDTFRQLYRLLDLPYHDGHLGPGRENPSISPRSIFFDRVLRKILRTFYEDPGFVYRSDFQKKPLWVSLMQKLNAEKYIYDDDLAKKLRELHSDHLSNFQKLIKSDENVVLISD